jgi:4-hydroxy-3-methylbut-2-enyl diphosphate reductase
VEQMLVLHGPPIYVRKQIVHNIHVVRRLEQQGAIFVESEDDVPEGATVVLSAHGVAPEVHRNAALRRLRAIDATCPLVTKVHNEAKRFAGQGLTIFLIGHAGHEEVVGTMGEAPDAIVLVQTVEDVALLPEPRSEQLAYLTQTTLSVDETTDIIAALKLRFPTIVGPPKDDICYATTNRQAAVKSLAREVDLVLVIGSANSSNSNRLVEVARDHGADSYLIDNEAGVREEWLEGKRVVGITSGASAPEELVQRLVDFFRARGTEDVSEFEVVQEDVRFMLPREIRRELAAR